MTLSLTINETLKWLLMQVILVVSVAIGIYSPSSHTSFPPSLISLMVYVGVKHHVYLLTPALMPTP